MQLSCPLAASHSSLSISIKVVFGEECFNLHASEIPVRGSHVHLVCNRIWGKWPMLVTLDEMRMRDDHENRKIYWFRCAFSLPVSGHSLDRACGFRAVSKKSKTKSSADFQQPFCVFLPFRYSDTKPINWVAAGFLLLSLPIISLCTQTRLCSPRAHRWSRRQQRPAEQIDWKLFHEARDEIQFSCCYQRWRRFYQWKHFVDAQTSNFLTSFPTSSFREFSHFSRIVVTTALSRGFAQLEHFCITCQVFFAFRCFCFAAVCNPRMQWLHCEIMKNAAEHHSIIDSNPFDDRSERILKRLLNLDAVLSSFSRGEAKVQPRRSSFCCCCR